jgi:hypothetical protein
MSLIVYEGYLRFYEKHVGRQYVCTHILVILDNSPADGICIITNNWSTPFSLTVAKILVCAFCLCLLPVLTVCAYYLCLLPVLTACANCLYLLYVLTACAYCLYLLYVLTACTYCLCLLSVLTVCTYCMCLLPVITACAYCLCLLSVLTPSVLTDESVLLHTAVAYPGIFFRRGGSTNSVGNRGQREWGSGGGSPLVRGSTQFANG